MNADPVQYRCCCGHEIRLYDSAPERYALLNEQKYEELIVNEARLFQTENDCSDERSELFFNQSQRIGSLVICPKCKRLIVNFPREPGRESEHLFHYYHACEEQPKNQA